MSTSAVRSAHSRPVLVHPAFIVLTLALAVPAAFAETIIVGPNEAITRIADAARIAEDGDTVLIMPGEYRGDVAVWQGHLGDP